VKGNKEQLGLLQAQSFRRVDQAHDSHGGPGRRAGIDMAKGAKVNPDEQIAR
jgi:hypothetical protein